MPALDKAAWEILNATADDCENLEQIYRQVCYEVVPDSPGAGAPWACSYRPVKAAPTLSAIADRIRSLVEGGFLAVVMEGQSPPSGEDLSYVWRAWFAMTPEGRKAWESSEHLVRQD